MAFSGGKLDVQGIFKHSAGVNIARVRFAGVNAAPKSVTVNGKTSAGKAIPYDVTNEVLTVAVGQKFDTGLTVGYR